MTDKVIPSVNRFYSSAVEAAIHRIGQTTWVVPRGDRIVSDPEGDIADGGLGGFDIQERATDGSFVSFRSGSAFVGGRWLARDTSTVVDGLDPTTDDEIVLGFDPGSADTVEVGVPANVSSTETATIATSTGGNYVEEGKPETPIERDVAPKDHSEIHEPTGRDPLTKYAQTRGGLGIDSGRVSTVISANSSEVIPVSLQTINFFDSQPDIVTTALHTDGSPQGALAAEVVNVTQTSADVQITNTGSTSYQVEVQILAFGSV